MTEILRYIDENEMRIEIERNREFDDEMNSKYPSIAVLILIKIMFEL